MRIALFHSLGSDLPRAVDTVADQTLGEFGITRCDCTCQCKVTLPHFPPGIARRQSEMKYPEGLVKDVRYQLDEVPVA